MASQSDKAKRAAATKAFKQRQQELEDQALIESTRRKCCFTMTYMVVAYNHSTLKSLIGPKPRHWKLQVRDFN